MTKLEAYLLLAPELKELYPDASVAVFDTEKLIAFFPDDQFKVEIKPGQVFYADSPTGVAIRTGKRCIKQMPEDLFGPGYIGIAKPVLEKGQVIGCITTVFPVAGLDVMADKGMDLLAAIQEVAVTAESLSLRSFQLRESVEQINASTADVQSTLVCTDALSKKNESAIRKSVVLGLGACMDAACKNQTGVNNSLDDVMIYAGKTKTSSKQIAKNIKNIQQDVSDLIENIEELTLSSKSQSEGAKALTEALEKVLKMTEQIVVFRKGISA